MEARDAVERTSTRFAFLTAVAWCALAIALLPDYGPTWDCVAGEYAYGESLLHALTAEDAPLREFATHPRFSEPRAPHPYFQLGGW